MVRFSIYSPIGMSTENARPKDPKKPVGTQAEEIGPPEEFLIYVMVLVHIRLEEEYWRVRGYKASHTKAGDFTKPAESMVKLLNEFAERIYQEG